VQLFLLRQAAFWGFFFIFAADLLELMFPEERLFNCYFPKEEYVIFSEYALVSSYRGILKK